MNTTIGNVSCNWNSTGAFNGIPCVVGAEYHIILDKQGKTTREFIESEEFQMLEKAGIEVHSGAYS